VASYVKRRRAVSTESSDEVKRTVSEMLAAIERDGADAVRHYSAELDGWDPESFRVGRKEIERAAESTPAKLRESIAFAQAQVRRFAEAQLATLEDLELETLPGVVLGHHHIPVGAVGAYVPGGRYPMLASAFMTVLVPKVAGVERVVACAPPREGAGIHAAQLHAMATSGADEILCVGGVQALAAMAFGFEGLGPVDMLVGPGNAYVAEAKRQLFGRVGIDLPAGPTEVLVIAEEDADPRLIAIDLLGQAEHGPSSPAVLITTSEGLAPAVLSEIEDVLRQLDTAKIAGQAWREHGEVVVVSDREEAIRIANDYAYEHLEVHAADDVLGEYHDGLRNYGSLFLGKHATVAYGDKAVGTNHVLPTAGAARFTGGLWVGKFLKTVTYQRLTEEGTRQIAPATAAISEAEMFSGHALSAHERLERLISAVR
jgi:sulfopropanediol 3-dehydrogenase